MWHTDKFGQRAFVGKVCMDLNDTVPKYKETTEDSIKETERYVHLSCLVGSPSAALMQSEKEGGGLCGPGLMGSVDLPNFMKLVWS